MRALAAAGIGRLQRSKSWWAAAAPIACALLVPAGAGAAARIAPDQSVATILSAHVVRSAPNDGARTVATVAARRPITGDRTVLPVLAQTVDRRGRFWLRVRLPGRTLRSRPPSKGWISASSTKLSSTRWHIVVDVRARRVVVYEAAVRTRSFSAPSASARRRRRGESTSSRRA